MSSLLALSTALLASTASAQFLTQFGNCGSFALHSGTAMTFAATGSVMVGDIGISPGVASATGAFAQPSGAEYDATSTLSAACQKDKLAAGSALASLPCTSVAADLAGMTLTPGVYCTASGAFVISAAGVLTLDGAGNPGSEFVFQAASTVITGAATSVALVNSAQGGNVYWSVGSSATLGAASAMYGNIITVASITMGSGSSIYGRGLANAAITCAGMCSVTMMGQVATPTAYPTPMPTPLPTPVPTKLPTPVPTKLPTPVPTMLPTPVPTKLPTPLPTPLPTAMPSSIACPTTTLTQQFSYGCDLSNNPAYLSCPAGTVIVGGTMKIGRYSFNNGSPSDCNGKNDNAPLYWKYFSILSAALGQQTFSLDETMTAGGDVYPNVYKQHNVTYYCDIASNFPMGLALQPQYYN